MNKKHTFLGSLIKVLEFLMLLRVLLMVAVVLAARKVLSTMKYEWKSATVMIFLIILAKRTFQLSNN
jgi:hypothetical protein